jgi:hypothetical protein
MSNVLICHGIKPRRPPETGKSGAIFEDFLLNSLPAGNCGRRNHKKGRTAAVHCCDNLTQSTTTPGFVGLIARS